MSSQKRNRRVFTEEFKLGALRLLEEGKTIQEVARDLEVAENLLYVWRKDFRGRSGSNYQGRPIVGGKSRGAGSGIYPGHGKLTLEDEEIRRLKRQVAILTEERDILKKATAFFAKESK